MVGPWQDVTWGSEMPAGACLPEQFRQHVGRRCALQDQLGAEELLCLLLLSTSLDLGHPLAPGAKGCPRSNHSLE